jgi:hypothetical protein
MRNKIIFAAVLFLVGLCAVHLYSYRKELGLYWREWSSFQRHFIPFNSQAQLRQPILSHSVSKQDPEAAAIVELIYQNNIIASHKQFLHDAEYLAEQSLKYPNNPYFLYDLGCRLVGYTYVDPQIIALIADRLIEIDPNNGRYYLLKAMAILYDWNDTRAEDALTYLEKCYSCPVMQDPYELYKARAYKLVEDEKLTAMLASQAAGWVSRDWDFGREFKSQLMNYTQDLIVNSKPDRAMRLHDQFQRIAEKSLPDKIDSFLRLNFAPPINTIGGPSLMEKSPQTVELKWMKPLPARFEQDRMQLRAWKQWLDQFRAQNERRPSTSREDHEYYTLFKLPIPLVAHSFQIIAASFWVLLFWAVTGLVLGVQKSKFSKWIFLWAPLFLIGYFALWRWGDYHLIYNGIMMCDHYTFDCVPVSGLFWFFVKTIGCAASYPYLLWILISLIGILLFVLFKKQSRWGLFRQTAIRLLIIVLIMALWSAIPWMRFGMLLLDVLILAFFLPLLCVHRKDRKAGIYYDLFSRSEEAMQYRWRCLVLCGSVVLVHLFTFGLFVRPLAKFTAFSVKEYRENWVARDALQLPRYTLDPNNYALLLKEFKTQKPWDMRLPSWLLMVEPEDIPGVITTLKERRENDPNGRWGGMGMPGMMGMPDMPLKGTVFDPDIDPLLYDLRFAAECCGKDALPYIKPFLKDPNVIASLAIRECDIPFVGRDDLLAMWQKVFSRWQAKESNPTRDMDWGQKIFLAVMMQWRQMEHPYSESRKDIADYSSYLSESLPRDWNHRDITTHLNRQQKGEVFAAVATLMDDKRLEYLFGQDMLQYNAELDSATKVWLWKQFFKSSESDLLMQSEGYQTLKNKPWDYHISDELLMSCMNSENVCLRAMGQHICRKLGKAVDKEMLSRWAVDSSPVVRAGAVLLSPEVISTDESSPFVRLMRGLAGRKLASMPD